MTRLIFILPLELQPLIVVGLIAVGPSALLLLLFVPAETRAELDVDAWWRRESESLGDLDEIELVHIEHGAE